MQLGHSGIVVYIFLIFLKMSFLELGHFGNTLHIYMYSAWSHYIDMYATFNLIISTPIEIRKIEYSGN